MLKSLFSILCLAFLLNACFSIKSEYPEIHFYDMTDRSSESITSNGSIPYSIYIKPFSTLSQFDTDQMIEKRDDNKIHRFFYHRWIEDFTDLFRNRTIAELTRSGLAAKGTVSNSVSINVPELTLEAQVIDAMAYAVDDTDNYSVTLEVEFTLKEYKSGQESPVLHKKIYKETVIRDEDDANSINIAFAQATNKMLNKLLNDLKQNVK